jgi:hypothetical protein
VYAGPVRFRQPSSSNLDQHVRPEGVTTTSTPHHANWAVVTTIFPPSEAVLKVAALKDWAVVVVGDVNSAPFNVTAANVVVLDATAQMQLGPPFVDMAALLPWRHFGRKNVGYMFAIKHGAQIIWDFDDDNILKAGIVPGLPSGHMYKVQAPNPACRGSFNPYPYMGGPTYRASKLPPSWPRGFPLDLIRSPCVPSLNPGNASEVAVVQSLADWDPDIDAVHRLTRPLPISFKHNADTLILSTGVMAPWNAQVIECDRCNGPLNMLSPALVLLTQSQH